MGVVVFSEQFRKSWERINQRHPVMAQQIARKIVHMADLPGAIGSSSDI